ncbi:hypothetical protein [Paludisphaera mucosa]|uniref:Uncharacterized protein n=1 Tax=Paludisphaera mucosa TaxID=3030827 RepID=A0ABT6FI68_9BACT|nr:hypothetical protein [Paludisphaera mucosa]MDG3007090.1 hypothetical protein [Paludisphaera mucosa]
MGEGGREPTSDSRSVVGVEVVDARCSDDFGDLAAFVAGCPTPPTWDAVRSLLEARAARDVWFSYRLRWRLDDGQPAEVTYVRQPYHSNPHFQEFLQLVRSDVGRGPADDASPLPPPGLELQPPLLDVVREHLAKDQTRPE